MMRYIKNSTWMLAEYGLRIISAIFVSIYVARYLGPDQFGVLSYALAIITIFMAVSRLGMDSILTRDFARYPEQAKAYMGTAFGLMLLAALINLLILSVLIYFFESNFKTKIYIWVISTGLLFQSLLVIDYGFQAQVKAKFSSIAKSMALAISSCIKVYLVWIQADLQAFAIALSVDHLIIAVMLLSMHYYQKQSSFLFGFNKTLIKPLLKSAWPMVLSAVAATLYMRVDQIMIKNMLDQHELGLYAAATKIYEGWVIIPYVISISLMPAIVKLKSSSLVQYELNMSRLFAFVFWPGILVAMVVTFYSHWVIKITFGVAFINAEYALVIVMWTAAFTAIGSVTVRYLVVEGLEKKIAYRTFIALIINVLLNLLLIPLYGIEGAAIATFITVLIANYFINYTDKSLNQLLRICNNAITLKLRHKSTS